mmetsp:Transcript_24553/g.68329  ORF Transcript_24553/g.68329 Transcript_24553/m.68329 type:complete len:236 (-) Transcript_24553:549-1256(-)
MWGCRRQPGQLCVRPGGRLGEPVGLLCRRRRTWLQRPLGVDPLGARVAGSFVGEPVVAPRFQFGPLPEFLVRGRDGLDLPVCGCVCKRQHVDRGAFARRLVARRLGGGLQGCAGALPRAAAGARCNRDRLHRLDEQFSYEDIDHGAASCFRWSTAAGGRLGWKRWPSLLPPCRGTHSRPHRQRRFGQSTTLQWRWPTRLQRGAWWRHRGGTCLGCGGSWRRAPAKRPPTFLRARG